jgi:hypothetical protein
MDSTPTPATQHPVAQSPGLPGLLVRAGVVGVLAAGLSLLAHQTLQPVLLPSQQVLDLASGYPPEGVPADIIAKIASERDRVARLNVALKAVSLSVLLALGGSFLLTPGNPLTLTALGSTLLAVVASGIVAAPVGWASELLIQQSKAMSGVLDVQQLMMGAVICAAGAGLAAACGNLRGGNYAQRILGGCVGGAVGAVIFVLVMGLAYPGIQVHSLLPVEQETTVIWFFAVALGVAGGYALSSAHRPTAPAAHTAQSGNSAESPSA